MNEPAATSDTKAEAGLRGLGHALIGALILGAAATIAEAAWIEFGIRHTIYAGLIHGALVFMVAGAVLGAALDPELAEGRSGLVSGVLGSLGGILAGLAGAGAFYLLARPLRSLSYFIAYLVVWLILGLILKALGRVRIGVVAACVRGLGAGLVASPGFYGVYLLWVQHGSGALVYLMFFCAWAGAFLPGFLALLLRRSGKV